MLFHTSMERMALEPWYHHMFKNSWHVFTIPSIEGSLSPLDPEAYPTAPVLINDSVAVFTS